MSLERLERLEVEADNQVEQQPILSTARSAERILLIVLLCLASFVAGFTTAMMFDHADSARQEEAVVMAIPLQKAPEFQNVVRMVKAEEGVAFYASRENLTLASRSGVTQRPTTTVSTTSANMSAKRWMDYRKITNTDSMQYQIQQKATTDEDGFRKVGDYYLVALGTYYADAPGETFTITLDTGESFKAMTGDIKANSDTNATNQYTKDGNVVEFIIDRDKISDTCEKMGDMSYAGNMSGKVVSIVKI